MRFRHRGDAVDCIPQNLPSWQETLHVFGLTVPLDVLQLYSVMDGDDTLWILAPDRDKDFRKPVLEEEGKNFGRDTLDRSEPSKVSGRCLRPSSGRASGSR